MTSERPSTKKSRPRCRWVGLLLTLSFLYNPFMAAAVSAGGLKVRHCASYRATVAATELQQLAPMGNKQAHLFSDLFLVNAVLLLPHAPVPSRVPSVVGPRSPQQQFASNLWFRPPPAL